MAYYFVDSGLYRSYPVTDIVGRQTGDVNKKFRRGLKCVGCDAEFKDGDVALRRSNGYKHEICPYRPPVAQ